MSLERINPSSGLNPFHADVEGLPGDGFSVMGLARIEPPFTGSEMLFGEVLDDYGVAIEHYATSEHATLVRYTALDHETGTAPASDDVYQEAIANARAAIKDLLDRVGLLNSITFKGQYSRSESSQEISNT